MVQDIQLNSKYAVFDNPTRYFVVTGGRGSGKSFTITMILLMLTYEVGHKILFTRYTMKSANLSIIPEFIQKIELLGAFEDFEITRTSIRNKISGSEIIFSGIKTSSGDQTANLKSLEGVTTWVLDEAEELTDEETFDKIDLSVRKKEIDNRIILLMNPTTKEHFIYKKFFEARGWNAGENGMKGDTTYIHTTYKDNEENLNEDYIKNLELMRQRRPEKFKHQILGGWLDAQEGVIFTDWSIGQFKEEGIVLAGQDFGYSTDPTTLLKVAIDKDKRRIYAKELLYKPHLTTSQIGTLNKRLVGNTLTVADSAEPRLIHELAELGCNIVGASKKEIYFGISIIQDYDLIVDPDSVNLIKELNNYVWVSKKAQTPCDAYNHLIDALRYAVVHALNYQGEYYF